MERVVKRKIMISVMAVLFISLNIAFSVVSARLQASRSILSSGVIKYSQPITSDFIGVQWYIHGWWWSWAHEEVFAEAEELKVKFVSFNAIQPYYGKYYVTEPSWTPYCGRNPLSKERIQETINLAHSHGMKIIAYLGPCECMYTLAESNYSDSIFYNRGHPVRGWWRDIEAEQTYVMNPDPSLSYGAEMLQQAKGILDDWGFDGIQVDRLDYDGWIYDRDQSEWISPHPNNPTPTSDGIVAFLTRLRDICDSRGKVLVGNVPRSTRTTPFLDLVTGDHTRLDTGNMTGYENLEWYEFYDKIVPPETPIWIQWYSYGIEEPEIRTRLEQFLKWCIAGNVYPCTLGENNALESKDYANKDLYELYLPQILQ